MYIYNEYNKQITKEKEVTKMAETLARVDTHARGHTQGNLINKKEKSIKNALLNIYARDG